MSETMLWEPLDTDDFAEVQEALWEARSKWHNIGTRLKLGVFELDCINAEPGFGLEEKFNLMIKTRLKKIEPCTWRDLYEALIHPTVDMPSVAVRLTGKLTTVQHGTGQEVHESSEPPSGAECGEETEWERERTCEKIEQMQKEYTDTFTCTAEEMGANVEFKKLRYSLFCLPPNLKKENNSFFSKAMREIKDAESSDDLMFVLGKYHHYLHYSLLKYIIDLHGSEDLKKKMADYVKKMEAFRKETRLEVFSKVCDDEPEEFNGRFAKMVTKHQMEWSTATLEDVEKFRIQVCRELSLYDFSLNLLKVARGCVEVTWRVPRSLVTYIQNSVKPSSQSMADHYVTTLTIDGFIAYESTFAMQNERKVMRLERQALYTSISYLKESLSLEKIVSYTVERKLLSVTQAADLWRKSSQQEILSEILLGITAVWRVGTLSTFCAALVSAGYPHVADALHKKFQCLLSGVAAPQGQQDGEEIMIAGESSSQPSPPPPDFLLITAQLEGSTLTRAQYKAISGLTSSLLCITTGDLVYDGHTLHPLTLHWHCPAIDSMFTSHYFLTEMAQNGMKRLSIGTETVVIPQLTEISLFNAALDGDVESLKCVLETEVFVDCTTSDVWSSLMMTSKNGYVDMVDMLLQHQATVDLQNKDGWSSLMLGSENGHVEVVDKLLQHGARVDLLSKDGWTSLMIASQNGHVEVVDKLIHHGATVDLQSKDGWTSLMIASQNGHVEVVDKLIQHEATVDLQSENGWTSLMMASKNGHMEVVDKLLQHGANVDLQQKDGWSALMLGSVNGHVEVVDKLLQHGARVDLQDMTQNTALTMACMNNDLTTVSVLLKAGENPNTCNKVGQTPLLLAVRKDNVAMVRELVAAGVDVNHIVEGGLSALMMCCAEGKSEMARLLLDSQANPDLQQSSTGYTALMFACKGGHLDTVMALMQHGANAHIRNIEGMTASDVASVNEFPDVCAVIQLMDPSASRASDDNTTYQYPGSSQMMEETVENLVRKFCDQMDLMPMPSFYDSGDGMAFTAPRERFRHHNTFPELDI